MAAVIGKLKTLLDAIDGDERFLMTLGAGMVNTALVIMGAITADNFVTLTLGTVAVFIGGSSYTAGVQIRQDAQVKMNAAAEAGETDRA